MPSHVEVYRKHAAYSDSDAVVSSFWVEDAFLFLDNRSSPERIPAAASSRVPTRVYSFHLSINYHRDDGVVVTPLARYICVACGL